MPTYSDLLEYEMCSFDLYEKMDTDEMYQQLCAAINNVGLRIFKIGGHQQNVYRKSGVSRMRQREAIAF